jgi:hypothetical protein
MVISRFDVSTSARNISNHCRTDCGTSAQKSQRIARSKDETRFVGALSSFPYYFNFLDAAFLHKLSRGLGSAVALPPNAIWSIVLSAFRFGIDVATGCGQPRAWRVHDFPPGYLFRPSAGMNQGL